MAACNYIERLSLKSATTLIQCICRLKSYDKTNAQT